MTVFAMTGTTSVTVPVDRGGCGEPHQAGELAEGERFAVDCLACEPHIMATRTGWAHDPTAVHLTPDEIGQVEHAERLAARQQNRTWSDPLALGKAITEALASGQQPAKPPTLLEQIAAMTPEEKAALRGLLGTEPDAADEPPPDVAVQEPAGIPAAAKKAAKKAAPPVV